MSDVEISERIARLEARKEIEDLKARYSLFCDEGYDPEGISGLFVDDGIWETTGFGEHVGKNAIKAFMDGVSGDISWAWHSITNPHIELDESGNSAVARWYSLVLCTRKGPDGVAQPAMMVGKYRDLLVLDTSGSWKFKEVRCTLERDTVMSAPWNS